MANVSRIGDLGQGICTIPYGSGPPHGDSGKIVQGAGSIFAEGIPAARIGDILVSNSHGAVGTIVEGSGSVYAEGVPAARIGSYFSGAFYGNIIEGAGSVFAGG